MLLPVYAALLSALLFYMALPLAGAFRIRSVWRRFRRRLVDLSRAPRLRYRDVAAGLCGGETAVGGTFRLYGRVEALEGENRLWVKGEEATALVDLSHSFFYILEGASGRGLSHSPDVAGTVDRVPWARVRVVPEGTKVFVAGTLCFDEGRPLFVEAPGEELLVVSYEGGDERLISRLVAGGRRRNEYWNPLSRISFALGIGGMGVLLAFLSSTDYFPSIRFLTILLALVPFLPFIPPGLLFFLGYRALWRQALGLRIRRDLFRLPLRYFPSGTEDRDIGLDAAPEGGAPLPEGGRYRRRRVSQESELGECLRIEPDFPVRNGEDRDAWVLFEPEDSSDPAAERVAIHGDPAPLAEGAEYEANRRTLVAGVALGIALIGNLCLAYWGWRLL